MFQILILTDFLDLNSSLNEHDIMYSLNDFPPLITKLLIHFDSHLENKLHV